MCISFLCSFLRNIFWPNQYSATNTTDYIGDACTNVSLHVKCAVLGSHFNLKWNVLQSLEKSQQISWKSVGLLPGFYKRTGICADLLKLLLLRFL